MTLVKHLQSLQIGDKLYYLDYTRQTEESLYKSIINRAKGRFDIVDQCNCERVTKWEGSAIRRFSKRRRKRGDKSIANVKGKRDHTHYKTQILTLN